jgi:hypothetical protein
MSLTDAVYDATFSLLASDILDANERYGVTPSFTARYDAASAAFDALILHVFPDLTPREADRLREQVVHYGCAASDVVRELRG